MAGYITRVGVRTPEVMRRSRATFRQLDHWARTGVLVPEIAPARGSGSQRLYSERDVAIAHVLVQMSYQGVQFRVGRRVVDVLRHDPDAWDNFLVIVDGAVIVTSTPGAVLADGRSVCSWVVAPAAAAEFVAEREEVLA